MEDIKIKGSHGVHFIPTVDFNAKTGVFEISGESYLEDTIKFYKPILDWLKEYTSIIRKPITFNFKLTYFNTNSSRSILDIMKILKKYEQIGGKVNVNWYYNEDDIDMEDIEDFSIDTDLTINLIDEDENILAIKPLKDGRINKTVIKGDFDDYD